MPPIGGRAIAPLTFPPDTVILSLGEESRYSPIVTHGQVNTGRREEDSDVVKILKVLRFDSRFVAEGCGIALGHALTGVRVQRVQKVLPAGSGQVQRVAVSPCGR